jgi:hypothetical protein
MQKHVKQFFFNSAFFNVYRKKLGQICQNYDVINIFPNGKLRFRLDYLIQPIFLDYKNLV